jgi:hypothetical protein
MDQAAGARYATGNIAGRIVDGCRVAVRYTDYLVGGQRASRWPSLVAGSVGLPCKPHCWSRPAGVGFRCVGVNLMCGLRWRRFRVMRSASAALIAFASCLAVGAPAARAATSIKVSSIAGTLGSGSGCTLRDALVVADEASNRALKTSAEPGGARARHACFGRVKGAGSPYTVILSHVPAMRSPVSTTTGSGRTGFRRSRRQ